MTAVIWTVLVALLVGFEAWALVDKKPHNTWTAWFYRHIRAYLVARLVAYPLLTWLVWHWILDDGVVDGDDLVAVGVGVVLALVATTRRPERIR